SALQLQSLGRPIRCRQAVRLRPPDTWMLSKNCQNNTHCAIPSGVLNRLLKEVLIMTLVIAALALTATSIAPGQEQSPSRDHRSSVEKTMRQLDNERIQSQIGADAVTLDRIYAADFIGVGPSGTVR